MKRTLVALLFSGVIAAAGVTYAGAAHADDHAQEHGAAAHGEHATGHDAHALPSINWFSFGEKTTPYIALLINFAILMAIYVKIGKKPIAEALKNRRASVAKEIEEAQRMRREAEERAKQYQAKLATLEQELDTTRQALIEAGKGERDRIVKEAEEKAERMKRDAQFLVEQEIKQLRIDLMKETIEAAVTAAESLLKERVTQADHDRLAEDFLAQLPGRKSAVPAPGAMSAPPVAPPPPVAPATPAATTEGAS